MRAYCFAAVALVLGCDEPTPAAPTAVVAVPDPPATVVVPTPPEIPADRRCGEPGATPTELPPAVGSGRAVIGKATLHANDTIAFGTVSVKWDTSAWIGNRGTGHRGDALVVLIDQAEAN